MIVKIYPANIYSFKFESNLTSTDIDFVDTDNSDADCYPYVYNFPGPRPYVLGLSDNNNAGKCSFDHTGFDITTTGAIEFLFKDFTTAGNFILTLYDGATRLVIFQYDRTTTKFQYDIGGGFQDIYDDTRNPWRIITITIDIDAGINGQFSCYYKNDEYSTLGSVTGIEFENNATTVDTLRFETEDAPLQAIVPHYFIDCIGITAEGGYTQGDIQYAEVNVSDYMENTRIHDGIIPYRKSFTFSSHPNYESYFNEGDYIDVWDVNEVLSFTGYIKTKSRDKNAIYQFNCEGMANEVFERTYNKTFTTDTTKEKNQDMTTNALEFCYEGTYDADSATDWSYEYNRACAYLLNLTRWMERQVPYIEPDGKIMIKDYDTLTATGKSWTLYDGNQNALLIDIPRIQDTIPGYYFGNTGITSVSVRYKNDTVVIRPATPVETFKKKRLKEFRDPKIQASTEANQLGDNLYNIFSADTKFLGMLIKGEGWLQPGETIEIENTNQITITKDDFLIVKVVYDPKNDMSMILSDNIITLKEFMSDLDTSGLQIHTATLQSFENQSLINAYFAIGSGNAREIPCILSGGNLYTEFTTGATVLVINSLAPGTFSVTFQIPWGLTMGSYKLYLNNLIIGLKDADANDYINQTRVIGWSDHDSSVTVFDDADNFIAPAEIDYSAEGDWAGPYDLSSYRGVNIQIEVFSTDADAFEITYVLADLYYDT